jgi:regulator of protease activity HflC (stomatin/prohibitin superfamily)
MFADLAHFNSAKRYVAPLVNIGVILAVIGLGLTGATYAVYAQLNGNQLPTLIIPSAFGFCGASLLIAAAGVLSAGVVTVVRRRLLNANCLSTAVENSTLTAPSVGRVNLLRRLTARARASLEPQTISLAAWPATLVVLLFSALAAAGVTMGWHLSVDRVADSTLQHVLAGALLVAAFPLLVLERSFAGISDQMLPDAPQLERLLRVPLTACLGLGISITLISLGFGWAIWIERATGLMIGLVALELMLRSLAMFFVPFAPIERLTTVADSTLAGLLRFSLPDFHALSTAVRQQFGIDLSRSWALAFIRQAMLPFVAGISLVAWGITGITALGLNQRAVYERFGMPVALLGPGLHFHLPWPLGVMRGVEVGVVHDIAIAVSASADRTKASQPSTPVDRQQQSVGAEAPAPASADRLWNGLHPSEQSYLIASETNGQQTFQIADVDLRVVYRVGLSDTAALDFAYRIADPETFIRATAGQLLVRYFSRYTLLDVLGQSRETFANDFRVELQKQLDGVSSGIEVIAVVVEAIHPPPGAAAAYHNVQAAEILANSQISLERANAIRALKSAEQAATGDRNDAIAAAAELVGQAKSESVLFDAAREAQRRDNQAFLLERRFAHLVRGLAKSEFIVIDHRLNGQNAPTIDLRSFDNGNTEPGSRDTLTPADRNDGPDDGEFVAPKSQSKPGSNR